MTRTLVVLLVGCVLGTQARGEDAAREVKEAIEKLNAAFEKGDAATVGGLMTRDHVAVTPYYGKPQSREEQLRTLGETKLSEYSAGRLQLRVLGKEVVLVTYPLKMKGTYRSKPVPESSHASAIWVKREGKWLEAYYQETALEK